MKVSGCKGVLANGFSLCTVPSFCCGPGILNVGRYGRLLGRVPDVVEVEGYRRNSFQVKTKSKGRGSRLRIVSGRWKVEVSET